ncbi:hypothetical protein L2E82_13631 [Cichorium intybus]|uniref:Uncharacterized protein n=1 Tax=Cichorium intybus TaxID=13427 RepID=A0ACB9EYI5_CICIN|nr:hypothetical protein L2E82_13631 [Cichorium intybus]
MVVFERVREETYTGDVDEYVFRLIFELVAEEDGIRIGQSFTITREDMDTVDRLEAMGFDRMLVWMAFFASEKNEELAANYLRNMGD